MASGDGSATAAHGDSAAGSDDQAATRKARQAKADEAEEARESKNGSPLNEEIDDILDDLPDE